MGRRRLARVRATFFRVLSNRWAIRTRFIATQRQYLCMIFERPPNVVHHAMN
jgi:hypothetical protein